ncbi:hypothetical protein GCM10018987_61180 [Streptomyces cremeus]
MKHTGVQEEPVVLPGAVDAYLYDATPKPGCKRCARNMRWTRHASTLADRLEAARNIRTCDHTAE